MAEMITLTGSYFGVGKSLGERRRSQIKCLIENMKQSEFYSRVKAYLGTPEGKNLYDQLFQTALTFCDHSVEELRGMAEGAGVLYDDLFILNIYPELTAAMAIVPTGSHGVSYASAFPGCTNVSIETGSHQLYFVHTEDIPPSRKDMGVMLCVEKQDTTGKTIETWTEYVVPGILPGSTFGFNSHGLMYGHNNIYQKGINRRGIPRLFIDRKLLTASDANEAKTILMQEPGIATAFTYIFLQATGNDIDTGHVAYTVLEAVGTENGTAIVEFHPVNMYHHCNILQHLPHPCHPEESSIHRASTISQYMNRGDVKTKQDLLRVMSDERDQAFPVYRSGQPPDYLATSATGLFDPQDGTLVVYTGKPTSSAPVHVLRIDNDN